MIITCCDSRVLISEVFGNDVPGDFFIHRNIANLVPPHQPDGESHGTSAAIEYATIALKVEHLIVMGHHACGGVLDVDSNAAGTRLRRDPVENVFFEEPPPGAYVIRVDFFGRNGDAPQQPFRVMIRDGEQVTLRDGVVTLGSGGRRQWMMTYNHTGN